MSHDPDDKWDAHWISRDIDQRTLQDVLLEHVARVYQQCSCRIDMTALVLGITRASVYSHLRHHEDVLDGKDVKRHVTIKRVRKK